jgi:hypothetical protein
MSGGNGREPRRDVVSSGSLAEVVLEIVGELADVSRDDGDGGTIWRRAGHPFAWLGGDVLEVRLQPAVARAALQTPDTGVSARGEQWVRFEPSELDRFAADRAAAWLESAWRHATA